MANKSKSKSNRYSFELMSGGAVSVGSTCKVYPLKIKEIRDIGYESYQNMIGFLTMNKEALIDTSKPGADDVVVYDIIAATSVEQKEFRETIEKSLSTFIKEPVRFFTDGAVFVIGTMDEIKDESNKLRYINRDNYGQIADIIRLQNLLKSESESKKPAYANEKARRLAEQRERGRKVMAEARGSSETTIEDLISMAAVFTQDLMQVMDWTIYQLHDQCEKFMKREEYDSKFQQLLAGADPKKLKIDKHWSAK